MRPFPDSVLFLTLICCILFSQVTFAETDPFEFKSDESIARMRQVHVSIDRFLAENRPAAELNKTGAIDLLVRYWTDNPDDYRFLISSSHRIVQALMRKTQMELDLILSDSEYIEDMTDINFHQFFALLQSDPVHLSYVLRNPRAKAARDDIRRHYIHALVSPLIFRQMSMIYYTKWNNS